jgi:hypothetical protein
METIKVPVEVPMFAYLLISLIFLMGSAGTYPQSKSFRNGAPEAYLYRFLGTLACMFFILSLQRLSPDVGIIVLVCIVYLCRTLTNIFHALLTMLFPDSWE